MPITAAAWIVASLALVGMFPLRRVLLQGRDHRQRRPQRLRGVHVGRPGRRRVPHRRVHRAGDLPHVLRRAPRRGGRARLHVEHEAPLHASAHDAPVAAAATPAADAAAHRAAGRRHRRRIRRRSSRCTRGDRRPASTTSVTPTESRQADPRPDLHPGRALAVRRRVGQPTMVGEQWQQLRAVRRAARRAGRSPWTTAAATAVQRGGHRGRRDATPPGAGTTRRRRRGLLLPGDRPRRVPVVRTPPLRCSSSLAGLVVGVGVLRRLLHGKDRRLVGLTERVAPLRWGYTFLANKYYLDALYEGVIVHAIAHPIARAANWVNQNVIDAVVNGAVDRSASASAQWAYRNIDQRVVDGAVNAVRRRRRGEPARRCAPCSRARSTSTVRCSSERRPWEPSCS